MTSDAAVRNTQDIRNLNWQALLAEQAYAYGSPPVSGRIKMSPQDFRVKEIMDVQPSGEGEHYWLKITKTRCNTEQVAKALARFSGVPIRDVGYSGMKDFQAVTSQWFSVWKPSGDKLSWNQFEMHGVRLETVTKHNRKIKRGTHRGNHFEIQVRDLQGDVGNLSDRLDSVKGSGVPNYFGVQRFGRGADNMRQACEMLLEGRRVKSRSLRGILLSSARSWLFNQMVSQRVSSGRWQTLFENEPANLDGSNSVFSASNDDAESLRLNALDIHPTAPMFGEGSDSVMSQCHDLHHYEMNSLASYQALMDSLVAARATYQRRAVRLAVHELKDTIEGDSLFLSFFLQRGQFATSVLRELLLVPEPSK